ncbi:hypothetical protein B0O99DRAFT_495675, partial [Bisporella sp. PMI_857]
VCRKLGIRYLWIDSLCIRQDSKEDWQVESQRMGTYYSNCTVCIAATGSANSMESFKNLLRYFPLLTRGWVMQERLLAPRVLHFCGSEVVFEC